ncbi:O-acetyl-ADP-ribose deacetylase macrod2 [Bulinus truncatus]|nr:O-acetyl-ADP-ribose deacetylase macrod2 [Bulinus truncatus]
MSEKIDTFKDDGTKSSNSITETEDLSTSPKTGNLSKIPKTDPELLRHDIDTITDKTEVKEKEIESNNETDDQKTKNVDSNIVIGDLTASPQADTSNPVTTSISELSKNDPELSHDEEKSEENTSNNETNYEKIKEVFLTMDTEKKRKLYRCSKYLTLDRIKTWPEYYSDNRYQIEKKCTVKRDPDLKFKDFNEGLNKKISLIQDDITSLEVDAIVNAANKTLLGGGGVDGAIHRAAGENLLAECKRLNGCDTGEAKITGGYKLPAKYVIHTVGPVGEKSSKLKNCYFNSLNLLREHNLKSIAFPCISTGIYGYPNKSAAKVALETVREWLELNDNAENVERIIFLLFPLQKTLTSTMHICQFFSSSPSCHTYLPFNIQNQARKAKNRNSLLKSSSESALMLS